jgi:hypothetical protein
LDVLAGKQNRAHALTNGVMVVGDQNTDQGECFLSDSWGHRGEQCTKRIACCQ